MSVHYPKLPEKIFFFISGAIISTPFPALVNAIALYFLSVNFSEYTAFLIAAAIIAPFVEEFAKSYPLFYRHGETERSIFSLGFLTGLGFGIAEFFLYVFLLGAPAILRLPLILFHATNTTITAYGIGRNKALYFFLIAVLLHFSYNLFLLSDGIFVYLSIVPAFASFGLSLFLYRRTRQEYYEE